MSIAEKAAAQQEYLTALRRDFHAHPEISLKEFRTAERIEQELDRLSIAHERCGETGVYAVLRGTKPGGGILVLRADTDALAISETHDTEYKSQNIQYLEDGALVHLRMNYLLPPRELYFLKLYSWPEMCTTLPCNFKRKLSKEVFDTIITIFSDQGYSFKKDVV